MNPAAPSKVRRARLHDVTAGFVERGEVPGLVALVSQRGEAHVEALGKKAPDASDPVERDTIFRIASMTKPITAVTDDTVPAPSADHIAPSSDLPHGLWHRHGALGIYPIQTAVDNLVLGRGMPQPSLSPGPDEWIRRLGTLPLMRLPGEKWMYHTGSDVPDPVRRARRVDRTRRRPAVRNIPARTHL
jgi:hypothetical protein